MSASKKLFGLSHPHGPGGVFFAWQRTSGGFLATTGYDQLVAIHNRHAGELKIFTITICRISISACHVREVSKLFNLRKSLIKLRR